MSGKSTKTLRRLFTCMEMGKPSKSGLVEDGRENTVREKAGLTEGWGRAKMVKAGYFRQSSSE